MVFMADIFDREPDFQRSWKKVKLISHFLRFFRENMNFNIARALLNLICQDDPRPCKCKYKNLTRFMASDLPAACWSLKSVHFKKTVARFSIQIKIKSTTILKESRIAELSS